MSRLRLAALGLGLVLLPSLAAAHPLRSGYLELRAGEEDGTFALRLGMPADYVGGDALEVRLEPGCQPIAPPTGLRSAVRQERSWTVRCPPADGEELRLVAAGLADLQADLIVRVVDGQRVRTGRLSPSAPTMAVPLEAAPWSVAATFLTLGVEHILQGFDHLLFIVTLVLLVGALRPLIATVTAFTLAHSLTLGAAVLGYVHVPAAPVEALIALSIAFLAAEVVRHGAGAAGPRPWTLAFAFGLLHGLGFAGGLSATGLPERAIPLALLPFNIGVELAQLGVIAAVLPLITMARGLTARWPGWSADIAPYAIGSVAMFWTAERVASFWG